MNGILIVDKPANWTSHDVIAKLRNTLKIKRIGHGGTLDPMATGVLPVFIGRATRAAEFCENAEKEYIAGLRLGLTTDTQDITGQTICESGKNANIDELHSVLPRFLGPQKQIPPMYSAIKQNGKKLYELARRGVEVSRPARDITISAIELLDVENTDFILRIACSKGTYIRTICHDIGAVLGTGGVMSSLRRTRAGEFSIEMSHTLDAILLKSSIDNIENLILPVDTLFRNYPEVMLNETDTRKMRNGVPCSAMGLAEGTHRFYGPSREFLALGKIYNGKTTLVKTFWEPL